jgi:hypothetical protein
MAAATLYREKRMGVSAIAKQLRISKSTLYSYLRHRGVELTPYKKPPKEPTPGDTAKQIEVSETAKIATIVLTIRVENNSKFVRGKKRARESIERFQLRLYHGKQRPSGDYELKVPYRTDEDLDATMEELFQEIAREADLRNCFTETYASMEGSDRQW